jgi:hypothetical protein
LDTLFETNSKEKPKQLNYNGSTVKVHPCEPIEKLSEINEPQHLYLLNCINMLKESVNKRDTARLESIVNEVCLENCTFKSNALTEPVVGRKYIVEAFQSLMRCSADVRIDIENLVESEINGSKVITMNHCVRGKL